VGDLFKPCENTNFSSDEIPEKHEQTLSVWALTSLYRVVQRKCPRQCSHGPGMVIRMYYLELGPMEHILSVQHRSSIGLSQLLLAFTTPEQVVGPVASSCSQLEQALAHRPAKQATACSNCEWLEATGPTTIVLAESCDRPIEDLC
jgi:hypothetical protein